MQEANLTQLLNIDSLLGKIPATPSNSGTEANRSSGQIGKNNLPLNQSNPQPLEWLNAALKSNSTSIDKSVAKFQYLDEALGILIEDVSVSKQLFSNLNPSRKSLIERRLEYIARVLSRKKGERFSKAPQLEASLKISNAQTWLAFASETALYVLLEVFFLKALDFYQWRTFTATDLPRLNFASHAFLAQRASGFAYDKHSWNFVRTNIYSWYIPSSQALTQISALIEKTNISWNDHDLTTWVKGLSNQYALHHLDFKEDEKIAQLLTSLVEKQLGVPFSFSFQGQTVCKKIFVPALELGSVSLALEDSLLTQVLQSNQTNITRQSFESSFSANALPFCKSIWASHGDGFEVFYAEVASILKFLRSYKMLSELSLPPSETMQLPHVSHIVQLLGLELHNLEQLPLSGPDVSKIHHGSAGHIQQYETFDLAIVTDHINRVKSARWLKALSEQLPYWKKLVGSNSNLNWGELHLHLALSKLKEDGFCVYVSHRVLPEGGDGDKLLKMILGTATLEAFIELEQSEYGCYKYLYLFRKENDKKKRDSHKPRFGKSLSLNALEESAASQSEIYEHGWEHIFVRGAAPLVRHLNHKFPKLFQISTVQSWDAKSFDRLSEKNLFTSSRRSSEISALEILRKNHLSFRPLKELPNHQDLNRESKLLVFPHNPNDLPWIWGLLNSSPVQFWIQHELLSNMANSSQPPGKAPTKNQKIFDVKFAPILDLSHVNSDLVGDYISWLGQVKPSASKLSDWVKEENHSVNQKNAKFVSLAKQCFTLQKMVMKYEGLFENSASSDYKIKPDAIELFYPSHLLCKISECPNIKVQYSMIEKTKIHLNNCVILDFRSNPYPHQFGTPLSIITLQSKQGPVIQILLPESIQEYVFSQLKQLRYHTWGEILNLVRVPKNISLFSAQVSEIVRFVDHSRTEIELYRHAMDILSYDLFEISSELRQYLT